MNEWVVFAAAALQGELSAQSVEAGHWQPDKVTAHAALIADGMMVELQTRLEAIDEVGWTWGQVEIFGHIRHIGRYRWTQGERFLDVEALIIVGPITESEKEGTLTDVWSAHRYGAKAIFSVSEWGEEEVRQSLRPYRPSRTDRGNASDHPERRDSDPPPISEPESPDSRGDW